MTLVISKKTAAFLEHLPTPESTKQQQALERFSEMQFPTTRDEYWKYTRLGKISNQSFTTTFERKDALEINEYVISEYYVVIENGHIREDLSSYGTEFNVNFAQPDAYEALNSFENADIFTTLNAAQFNTAIEIKVAAKQEIKAPLQLIFINHGENIISNNRISIHSEKSSAASVLITNASETANNCFNNVITDVKVDENAHLTIDKIQAENETSLTISTEQVTQDKNSVFKINTFTLNGLLVRNNINIAVAGQNCETHMNGAVISKENQHIDNHTFVDHQVSNCFSNENYKYVMDGKSTGVFNGRVVVRKDAQVINAYQNNGNILLSDDAKINSKPELEIYADDVKCSHGSTTGQLDENALFYLQARGISKENARKILVGAFVGEVMEAINNEKVTELVQQLLQKEHGWSF